MKRFCLLCLTLALVCASAAALADGIPEVLRFTQNVQKREEVRDKVYIQRTYPDTANDTVDETMRQVIDDLTERSREFLPQEKVKVDRSYLKTGANITRTGDSWMSFLSVAYIKHGYEQTHVDFDARVYDMNDGRLIRMTDLLDADSEGWQVLADAVREQLTAYFPDITPDSAALDALCSREALENAAFTVTPASVRLHYRAEELYPGHDTLMHVHVLFSAIRPLMTEAAQAATDCSGYKLVALTFDDGPAHLYSTRVVDLLQRYGAQATFFVIGSRLNQGHYVVACEHDAGHSVGYHSYSHTTGGNRIMDLVQPEWEKFKPEIASIIGRVSTVMRAPGGYETPFVEKNIGIPIFHWNVAAGDGSGSPDERTGNFINRRANAVRGNVRDGAVVLMHDQRSSCADYLEMILENVESKGFLCVTVEELFDARGIKLEPNGVYYGAAD